MKSFRKIISFLFLTSCFLPTASCLYASGISTNCGEIYLENLKIGQTYSLRQLLGRPFDVTYTGISMADLEIKLALQDVHSPDGFEPIRDASWIRIEKDKFSLDPGQTAETDIFITIPNNPQYMGTKLYCWINPQASPPKTKIGDILFGTGLICKLKLIVAAKPPTPEEIRQLKKQMLGQIMNFAITPERIFLVNIEPGKRYDLKKDLSEMLKIVNTSDFIADIQVNSIEVKKNGLFPPVGYIEAPDPNWLKVKKKKFKMKENTINEIPLEIEIPKSVKTGESYYFVIVIDVTSKIRTSRYYTKVYVDTKKEAVKPASGENKK
ncbi:MAG: hypothetical protein ABII64_08445 [Elusimicrobiota bacterium]